MNQEITLRQDLQELATAILRVITEGGTLTFPAPTTNPVPEPTPPEPEPMPPSPDPLRPYEGEWTARQAAHLLRRAQGSLTWGEVQTALEEGRKATVERLVMARPEDAGPLFHEQNPPDRPQVPLGQPWVGYGPGSGFNLFGYSLSGWYFDRLRTGELGAGAKLLQVLRNVLALHGSVHRDARYQYLELLGRQRNYRQLIEEATLLPYMLSVLNGDENKVGGVNENFARELLELFVRGIGNYTEGDIRELARALTGWLRFNPHSEPLKMQEVQFLSFLHDEGDKVLSDEFFGGRVITNAGDKEYLQAVDAAFDHPSARSHFVGRLYRQVLCADITAEVEATVIQPLAEGWNYDIDALLTRLLNSQHFYECGPQAKCPEDFLLQMVRYLPFERGATLADQYHFGAQLKNLAEELGQSLEGPAEIFGWPAYYQEPVLDRAWLEPAGLARRQEIAEQVATGKFWTGSGVYRFSWSDYLRSQPNIQDLDAWIDDVMAALYPLPLEEAKREDLRTLALGGMNEFHWASEVDAYLAAPQRGFEQRLEEFFTYAFTASEFHIQ